MKIKKNWVLKFTRKEYRDGDVLCRVVSNGYTSLGYSPSRQNFFVELSKRKFYWGDLYPQGSTTDFVLPSEFFT